MYFVEKEKIKEILRMIEKNLEILSNHHSWNSEIEKLALERITQLLIDSVLDIGNLLIDGFIMRDPGSYEDIVDILVDEQVISKEMGAEFKHFLPLRKLIINEYLKVDHKLLVEFVSNNRSFYTLFPNRVREYLRNNQDVITAFGSNHERG